MRKIIFTFVFAIIIISSVSCTNNFDPDNETLFFKSIGWSETDTKKIFALVLYPNQELGVKDIPGISSITPYNDYNRINEELYEFKTVLSNNNRTSSFFLSADDIGLPSKINIEDTYTFVFITDKQEEININKYKLTFNQEFDGISEITLE
ncbi:hypothetical protein VQL36_14715 [Chengkuizengella sp. SCS-71B]|uniref:hypothetical protein n=1 Tax=Chengkuizengella sp. SCS-71B TaxID=3115290 RepID=UPI0032C23939